MKYSMPFTLEHIKNIYFLGIGGIGMSALAHYFHLKEKTVVGYDRVESIVTKQLEEKGIKIFYTLDEKHIEGIDLVVYTPAISRDCVELQAADRLGIPVLKRSQVLGKISETYRTLAVAGTHGKTTTSTMLTHVLNQSGASCTAFLGGISNNLKSNFTYSESDLMVVEADEYDRSFMTLKPDIAVITSMDADHLDIYGTPEAMQENYLAFSAQAQRLVVHEKLSQFFPKEKTQTFGMHQGHYRAENLRYGNLTTVFDFVSPDHTIRDITLHMPGQHNVLNMVAALAVSVDYQTNIADLKSAVESFSGIYRRFQVHYHSSQITYIDDYAHHPSEIEAVISTARALFPERELTVVFQPHLFTRTRDFAEGFAEELSKADRVVLMEIYPARENPIVGVDSSWLLEKISLSEKYLVRKEELTGKLKHLIQSPSIIMTLGAGDIDRKVEEVKKLVSDFDNK